MESMVFHIFAVLFTFHSVSGLNQIYISGTSGPDVVEATVNVIRESCIFPNDHLFLRRLAFVESRDGVDPKTYRTGYFGGIWQVDQTLFHDTQSSNPKFAPIYATIKNKLQIDWMAVVWSDLTKPLYSGLAAYIYTFSVSDSSGIPRRIEEQGVFWTTKFHQSGTAHNFTILAGMLAKGCHGNEHQDIVFILDSSASLSAADFTQTKSFVENVISLFTIDVTKTRVAVVVYSSQSSVAFNLNSFTTKASLMAATQSVPYIAGGTNTRDALNMAVNDVLFGPVGDRHDAAKIIILVTDGKSNDETATGQAAAHARTKGVVVFAIGVGTQVSIPELNLVATDPDCTHVFTVSGYNDIIDIKEEIEKSSCTAPLLTSTGQTCLLGECRQLAFNVPKEGLTVYTNTTCPSATMYAAFNNPLPNGAYYEFIGHVSQTQSSAVFVSSIGDAFPLYVTIQGMQSTAGNCYITIIPIPGHLDHTLKICCKQDGMERSCNSSDLYKNPLCEELWLFTNPCTDNAINQNELCYPYPYDHTKYILCTLDKKAFINQCPQGEAYMDASHKCVGVNSETALRCGYKNTSLDALYCTIENHLAKKFYFTYPPDINKFIQCDDFGKAFIMDCQPGMVWDQTDLVCIRNSVLGSPIGVQVPNPCIRGLVHPRAMFHPYPLDPHSYIECDAWGQAYKMGCPTIEVWNDVMLECDELWQFVNPCTDDAITQNNLCFAYPYDHTKFIQCTTSKKEFISQCPQGEIYEDATKMCVGPLSQTPLSCGHHDETLTSLYCTAENILNHKYYFTYTPDVTKYVQCDAFGHAYLMECPRNFIWDQNDLQCIRITIIGDPLHTGINPCIRGLTDPRHVYHVYPLHPHRYIQCDPWGEAFVMTCPASEIWHEADVKCGT